jgi:hypothetical protein
MGLKILCAGCSKDEREQAEAQVTRVLAERARTEDWSVSLVKLGGRFSVTLDAPAVHVRGLSVMADQARLADAIREALGRAPAPARAPSAPAAAPVAPKTAAKAAPASDRGPHRCDKCGGGFVIVYETRGGESMETAAVACPHCWYVNRVLIDADAAFNRDYRAEKA